MLSQLTRASSAGLLDDSQSSYYWQLIRSNFYSVTEICGVDGLLRLDYHLIHGIRLG